MTFKTNLPSQGALKALALVLAGQFAATDAAFASTTVIEGWQAQPSVEKNIDTTNIIVEGNKTRYTGVRNKKVNAWIVVKGHAPNRANRALGGTIRIENKSLGIESPTELATYKVRFDYIRPVSQDVVNTRLRPVKMCNDRLSELQGSERTAFLKEGNKFWVLKAYNVSLTSGWEVRARKSGIFQDPPSNQTWENSTTIDAKIICLPLDKNAGAKRTNVSKRTNPPPPDPSTLPRLKKATLDISPFAVEKVGRFECPTKLRLKGFMESNRAMRGATIFVGTQWLSGKKDFKFDGAQTMNHITTYPLKWDNNINSLGANTGAPYRQDLTFKFNVANGRGKLVKSVERNIRVTCK